MQGDQQAYDRGVTVFSPDGRLYQVEYAREAVERGTASVGLRTSGGVAFAVEREPRSPLMEAGSIEKLHHVDDHVGMASAGHAADARRLVDLARRRAQGDRLQYGEPMDVESLTKAVTDHVQERTQTGGARPYGTALLVGGVDENGPRLFETDPSGTPSEWRAGAIGRDADSIRSRLEDAYESGLDIDAGLDVAVEALAGDGEFSPARIGIATVGPDGYREHDESERRERLERLGLLAAS